MDNLPTTGNTLRYDGKHLKGMLKAALAMVERNIDSINALNVFPVPDGDTGTNMYLTLRGTLAEVDNSSDTSLESIARSMAHGSLMEARGNSGVILSQIFGGIAAGLGKGADFDSNDLANSYRTARDMAYKGVGNPVQGTMLTVMDAVADSARESSNQNDNVETLCNTVLDSATEAVKVTTSLNPILRNANVVDAGGHGLAIILEGFRNYFEGSANPPYEISTPEPYESDDTAESLTGFLESVEHVAWGYCTQVVVSGDKIDVDQVRENVANIGRSTVVVGTSQIINIHVHVEDPGPILSMAVGLGTLQQVKIENMDEQNREYSRAIQQSESVGNQSDEEAIAKIIAIGIGDGIVNILLETGVSEVVLGGDTMNPSVQQIVESINRVDSDSIIILPNNPNIVPAAIQASGLSSKQVRVVKTLSVPQGIAAALAFSPELSLESNFVAMDESRGTVKTGEVCRAVRPSTFENREVAEGDAIGLLDRELIAAGTYPIDVLVDLIRHAGADDGELVTLYWGKDIDVDEANHAQVRVEIDFPNAEVELVYGGQPGYLFIVSIE